MAEKQKILVSGVKPTGRPHIGNYFGAMKQFVDMLETDDYKGFIFIADYHALTTTQDSKALRQNILDIAIDYLAIGLDPKKVILYKQSDVPEVTELTWVFNCLTTVPYLGRAHAYKDAVAKGNESNVGLFDYPVLMASDILIMNADIVPVGQDQKQHIEITRDIGEKFNRTYGEIFSIPEAMTVGEVSTVPGTDGQKMSKSYANTIPLFATEEQIKNAVMSIPTDSKGVDEPKNPKEDIVFKLHKLFSADELDEIRNGYEKGGLSYADSKKKLIKNISKFITPLREKREKIAKNPDKVKKILEKGAKEAREVAQKRIQEVRSAVGLEI